jgi:hypothetical protein
MKVAQMCFIASISGIAIFLASAQRPEVGREEKNSIQEAKYGFSYLKPFRLLVGKSI